MKLPISPVLALWMFMISAVQAAHEGGFLFATFKGEATPMDEQIHFGLSRDGLRWKALRSGRPVLVSKLGEKGVRDPFLLRSHDGRKTYLIATDLSIYHHPDWKRSQEKGSRSIVVWESVDLVKWSEPRLVEVAAADAGCTWAPEAVYDAEAGDYLVFWASKHAADAYAKQRIWAARTRDFRQFGKPFLYLEQSNDVIDTTIIREQEWYYRFSKDETVKSVTMERSRRLMGGWEPVKGYSLGGLVGYEGPTCFPLEAAADGRPGRWCLLLDFYQKGLGYQPYVTEDLAAGTFRPVEGVDFPFPFRHGAVLRVTEAEYQKLGKAFPVD